MSSPDFIETEGSLERIENVSNAILSGNPILLEGETGTSKTRTAIEACRRIGQEPIVINCSSQTTIEDLIGRIAKDTESWGGFSFTYGPYTEAFVEGKCLILDEINLAYENVLQCIEASLDSGKLFLEISGSETKSVDMNVNFHLIATQNPLKGRFSQKRQFLSQKFRSRFQTISFVDIKKDELLEIAKGFAQNIPISEEIIQKLIDFHFIWKEKEASENQIHVFTIREISGTIKSMREGLSPYESIMIHYGSRYSNQKLQQIHDNLIELGIMKTDSSLTLPPFDKNLFYMTQSIQRSILNSYHLLQTYHPILITGPDGCGKTAFARWIAQIYNSQINENQNEEEEEENDPKKQKEIEANGNETEKEIDVNEVKKETDNEENKKEIDENEDKNETDNDEDKKGSDENDAKNKTDENEDKNKTDGGETSEQKSKKKKRVKNQTNVFICNPEVSISDIIGRYMPVMGAAGEAPIMWIDGPVIKSLKKGDCLIMDQISIAPSTILERMNSLYDSFGKKGAKFSVQENSEEDEVHIHPNFRIIATSSLDGLNDISPALLNRFTIIYIDDQLNELFSDKNKITEFITYLSPKMTLKGDLNLITEYAIRNRNEMTMSRISLIVKGFFSLKREFPRAVSKSVLNFCVSATAGQTGIPTMDENFIQLLLKKLEEDKKDSAFDTFIYKEAEATRKIMAALVAAFIAGFHVVLIGKTGLGKTSAAIALSRLCTYSKGRQFISFNGETQLEELFGFFTIEKGNFTSHAGPLSDALESGKIFIADELNLADQMIIQSLNVAIEPSKNEQIILPVIGKNIVVNEHFFFIGCQNDVSMYGRKPLPESFKKKVLSINYPENSYTDLISLTSSLANEIGIKYENTSVGTTNMIENMKKDHDFKKKIWSLREVRKLYRRTYYIEKHTDSFIGFSLYTNAAFLLRSAFRDTNNISEKVAKLVSNSFKSQNTVQANNQIEYSTILNNLTADVIVTKINRKNQIKLTKNKLSLKIINSELLKIPETLQSFWQTLFEVYITHPSEPLLFVGPSGFKTFLAKTISPRAPVVYLHSDTTISSLIGQITLLDKDQARQFLLESLYNFAGPAPVDEFQELFKEIRESEVIDIPKIQQVLKYINNPSFTKIVENVIQQLIDIDYSQQDENLAFSNYMSVFKPGLITKYILKQNSLILRNIAQPSPTVLERLNELLSVKPTLTLFEDTSNTFTPADEKVLSKLSDNFRIIGICLPREKRGLSEAMLSRLTEISVPRYTDEDQEKVIDSILLQSDLNNDSSINLYKELLNTVGKIFIDKKETIPFVRIIEIVRLAIEWRKFYNNYEKIESEESLFSLALFRCAAGPLPFNNKKIFIESFFTEESGLKINYELRKIFEEKQEGEGSISNNFLIIEEEDDKRIIRSTLSNCFVPTPLSKLPESDICFTSSIKDLIDTIISASVINHPLILEGPNGSGKSTAFFYLSKCVDANVVRISISSSTTVEDLLGKYEPNTSSDSLRFDFQPTEFLNAIRSDRRASNEFGYSSLKKQWIIIEELHLASASVLDSLAPVFNTQTNQILLPDGTIIAKGNYFIVGLISQPLQNQTIINSSMIYKIRDYTETEYKQIFKFILSKNNFNNDVASYFSKKMFAITSISATSQFKIPVTVREVHKFLNLYDGSEGKMEIEKIIRILCLGRFTNDENVKEKLNYNDDNYKLPEVSIEISTLNSGGIPMQINAGASKRQYDIQYLSSSEKELFVFLSMAMKKYTPIIVQGPTASGKTYSVQLYADIVGKPLRIIQLNSEITSQAVAGTFQPSKNLSNQEMDELQEALNSIADLPDFPEEFISMIDKINSWSPKDFKKLRSFMQNKMDKFNPDDQEKASVFIKKVDNLLQFYNHLKRADSVIIKAMVEGSWLLLDGIEAAPSDFFDRLYTLFDDQPILNLYERGNGFVYSWDSKIPERRIHPDFRLIMTYNCVDVSSISNFSTSLLSRCTVFSMKAIDSNLTDSSLVIFGFLNQIDFNKLNEDTSELSIKLGKTHMAAKELTSNSQFSATGRTLVHLCHNLEYKNSNTDYDILKNVINSNYGSLMSDLNKFDEVINEKFDQVIDVNILEFIKKAQLSTSKGCIEIINLIDNFINTVKENIQTKFDFEAFLHWLLQIHLKDIETIHDKIRYSLINTLRKMIIDISANIQNVTPLFKKLCAHWSSIRSIEILIDEISHACQDNFGNEFSKNATLNSPQVQEIVQFQIILKKIRCIFSLIQKGIFIMQSFPFLFFDSVRKEFFSIFQKIDIKKPFNVVIEDVKKLEDNEEAKIFFNFQENPIFFLDSIIHFNESNNWPPNLNTAPKMISSCLFFNDKNSKYLFKGICRDFYLSLLSLLNDETNISLFNDLVEYVGIFYQLLEVDSFISLDELVSCFEERSTGDQKQFSKFFQNLRTLNNKSPFKDNEIISKELKPIELITNTVNNLYQDYNKKYSILYLQRQKDQDAAKGFYQLIENINNRLETEVELKKPLELYVKLTYDIDIDTESFTFLRQIYQSIKVPKDNKVNNFKWPHSYGIKFSDELPAFSLMNILIEYSKKAQFDFTKANWMTLCSIESNTEFFLEQFLNNNITQVAIEKYQMIIKAQLLYELLKTSNDKYKYCTRDSIINFFNSTINRTTKIDQTLVDLAHHYELSMDRDFVINIPSFNRNDIISMLMNPIDQSLGPIFNDSILNEFDHEYLKNIYTDLIEGNVSLFDKTKNYLLENGIRNFDSTSFEKLCKYIVNKSSIEKNVQDFVQALFTVDFLLIINDPRKNTNKLRFEDVPSEFNEKFIDAQPYAGFYISFHQEVLPEIKRIKQLCDQSSFPLSLFIFREYSNQSIIEINLPSSFSSKNLSSDVEEFILKISNIIITNTNSKKISKFSNLIGFLIDQPPLTLNTQRSEHFREILLDIISKPLKAIIMKYIINYLQENIENYINILGSNEWDALVKEDYTNTSNEFLQFLINPWKQITSSVKKEFKQEKSIYSTNINKIFQNITKQMIRKFNNRGFFNQILDATRKDEKELQTKIRDEYYRINGQKNNDSFETSQMQKVHSAWKKYCSYMKKALELIPEFPGVSNSNFPFSSFYKEFISKHLDEEQVSPYPTSDHEETLIAITPKKKENNNSNQEIKISYNKRKEIIIASGNLVQSISIVKLPKNTAISDLNIQSNDVDFKYYHVFIESSVNPKEKFSLKEMIDSYKTYKNLLDHDKEEDSNLFGTISVSFHTHNYKEFINKIEELSTFIRTTTDSGTNLEKMSQSSSKILSKMREIEDYFPASFPNETEIPKETNRILESFKDFINQSGNDLSNIHISQDLIDADNQFIVNIKSEFNQILDNVKRFSNKSKLVIDEGTIPYSDEEFIHMKSLDKLIIPTIFIDENDDFRMNINHLQAKFGPYLKGNKYSDLKFKIINLTKHNIKCVFHQDDISIDLNSENENGFFNLVFPIDKIVFDYNENSEIKLTGKIDFYEFSSDTPFKEMTYDIVLVYLSPTIFLEIENYSFAIKDGEAQVLPYYSIENSSLLIKAIPLSFPPRIIELPNNTAKQPKIKPKKLNTVDIKLPSAKDINENHLEVQIDFGLSNTVPAPISLDLTLNNNNSLFAALYCDSQKDFRINGSLVTIGNLWRDVYILVSYFNPTDEPVIPSIIVNELKTSYVEIQMNENESLKPYLYNVIILSFRAKLISKPPKRLYIYDKQITVKVGNNEAKISFTMLLDLVYINKKMNIISTSQDIKICSYWDNNQFIIYEKKSPYKSKETNLIVSPVSYDFTQTESSNLISLKFDKQSGQFIYYRNNSLFEVLILDMQDQSNSIKIIDSTNLKQKEGRELKLFARIKGKPDTVFPLFGECKNVKLFNATEYDYKQNGFEEFIEWFEQFLPDHDKNRRIIQLNPDKSLDENGNKKPEFICGESLPSSFNFSYLIYYLIQYISQLPYMKLVNKIKEFTGSDQIFHKYKEASHENTLGCKLISLVYAIYDFILIQMKNLRPRHYVVEFPVSFEIILEEQKKLLTKNHWNKESVLNSNEYMNKKNCDKAENFNKKKEKKFKENKFAITSYAKWTFESKFQEISKDEFFRTENDSLNNDFKKEISPQYSKEAGNIEISNVSFDNMSSIINTYNAFDSILRNAYQFTISIHSCLLNKKKKEILHHNVEVFNQLISFYLWVKEIKDYSPYPSFFNKFFSAYQAMMSRLMSAGMTIYDGHIDKNVAGESTNFIEEPKSKKELEFNTVWLQPGKNKKQNKKENIEDQHMDNPKPEPKRNEYEATSAIEGTHLSKGKKKDGISYNVEVSPQIITSSTEAEEVPNQEYIDYIISKMIHPGKEKNDIRILDDDKTHIPDHYDLIPLQEPIKKIDYFFDAAETLTCSILDGIAGKTKLLDNIDNCYASILIDCSNTFSLIQKASLILLTITYGNALTALRIPYSIIIFCDDNFQVILKKLEDKHQKNIYLKLVEAMTVNRRMSSMSDAIQVAQLKSKPSKYGPYSERTNHVIYTLSDGLSTTLNLSEQWIENILNDESVTVSFFFLSIIPEEALQDILKIWSKFSNKISTSKSPTTVFYSTYENIFTNKEFFSISSNKNDNSLTKFVPLSECFSQPLIQSIPHVIPKSIFIVKQLYPLKTIDLFKLDIDLLTEISELLKVTVSNESKYYKNDSDEILIDDPIDIEIPSFKINPFNVNIEFDTSNESELYTKFHTELYNISSALVEQSSIQEMSSFIFIPNKPSQFTPSSDGTLFYFPGLIRFLLTQGQDTKIFLEKKAGLTRSYSIFVIIDCTTSCFNVQSSIHAIQSIFILLQTIAKIDLPSFNLIITTSKGPRILCCEKSTFDALSANSPIWATLLTLLLNPHEDSYLDSALLSVLSIRSQQKTFSSVLFLFTDGNFSSQKQRINNSILEFISSYQVEAITIGIGSFSSNISLLSTKKVWSVNPRNVVKAILAAFGKETSDLIQKIATLYKDNPITDYKDIGFLLSSCLEFNSINDYILKDLVIELNSITRDISVFTDFYNIQNDGDLVYSEDSSHDIGKKNFYRGVKVLICQFWDESMSYSENEKISKEVLINGSDETHKSVINSLKDFGIETYIVQNYLDAIKGLSSGEYSQAWIICGRYDGRMPDKSKTANLINQFIEVLIIYWNNGGGLVFWTDNSPLDAEVNFFLSKAEFENNQTLNFRIGGSYPGNRYLKKSQKIQNATFTAKTKIECDGYQKWLFNANMDKIFEGKTIASAIIPPDDSHNECYDDPNNGYDFAYGDDIYPFKYFSISSSGGISSLYYNAPLNSPKGDIVIDCGFSKLFFELSEESIFYYVRNIAIFMLSIEKKTSMIGGSPDPKKFKPKKFEYFPKLYDKSYPKFYNYNEERAVDIVFLIDGTGSMWYLIEAVLKSCNDIARYCKDRFPENSFKFGAVIYRDNAVKEIRYNLLRNPYSFDETEISGLNSKIRFLEDFLSKVDARGGGNDGPEDWLSGYQRVKTMKWRPNSEKVVIHIADAASHGRSFNEGDFQIPYFTDDQSENEKMYLEMDEEHNKELPKLIKWVAEQKIQMFCLSSSRKSTMNSFKRAKKIYEKAGGKKFNITKMDFDGDNISEEQKDEILRIVRKVAISSVDSAVAVISNKEKQEEQKQQQPPQHQPRSLLQPPPPHQPRSLLQPPPPYQLRSLLQPPPPYQPRSLLQPPPPYQPRSLLQPPPPYQPLSRQPPPPHQPLSRQPPPPYQPLSRQPPPPYQPLSRQPPPPQPQPQRQEHSRNRKSHYY